MKLKLIVLAIIVNILLSLPFGEGWGGVKAQTWCPPGATWHYSTEIPGMYGYSKYAYTSDTIINTINCKKIITFYEGYSWSVPEGVYSAFGFPFYTYEQNGVVFLYNNMYGNNKFDTLFNINAQIGDKWRIALVDTACADSLYFMQVLSKGTKVFNGLNLQWLYVKRGPFNNGSGEMIYTNDTILERIGYKYDEGQYAVCYGAIAEYYPSPLRCYSDSIFGFYSTGTSTSCDYFTTNSEEKNFNSFFSMYPNPAVDGLKFFFNYSTVKEAIVEVKDMQGKSIDRFLIKADAPFIYNVERLKNSIYTVSLHIDNELIENKKLIIIK